MQLLKVWTSGLILLFCLSTWPKLVKREVVAGRQKAFSLRQVCQSQGKKNLLLASALNTRQVDCMGEEVSTFDFCSQQHFPSGVFLRGYIDVEKQRVVCESGDAVWLVLACRDRYQSLCDNPERSCRRLKSHYARHLQLLHHSVLAKDGGQNLQCLYAREEDSLVANFDQ